MKLSKKIIKNFVSDQSSSNTRDALIYFGDAIALSFLSKPTTATIKSFEADATQHGLAMALHNVIFNIATGMLRDIDVTSAKSKTAPPKGKK